jgi:hypothetical protein
MQPQNPNNSSGATQQPMQQPAPVATGSPYQQPKSSPNMKKILMIVLPIVGVLIISIVGLLVFSKMNKTSAEALKKFSSATSELNSKSSNLGLEVSKSTYDEGADLDPAVKQFDESIKSFEGATSELKSDRKDLKIAAEGYIEALKSYGANEVGIATDMVKIASISKKESEIDFKPSASSDLASYTAEVDRITGVYTSLESDLKDLDLKTEKGKELKDSYSDVFGQIKGILVQLKTAVAAGDRGTLSNLQSQIRELSYDNAADKKKKELEDLVGYDSEGTKKIDAAQNTLNVEIDKINSRR